MRTLHLIALCSLSIAPAASADPGDHPEKLLLLMRLIDEVPTRAQMIEAGSGENGEALLAIARDASLPRYPRMRAAGSLALFESNESRIALAGLIDDPALGDHEVKIQALAALVHLEGAKIRPRLDAMRAGHPHPELRAAAARQLDRLSVRKGL